MSQTNEPAAATATAAAPAGEGAAPTPPKGGKAKGAAKDAAKPTAAKGEQPAKEPAGAKVHRIAEHVLYRDERELPCELSEAERIELGARVGALSRERRQVQAELDAAKQTAKGRLGALETEIDKALSALDTGREIRNVPVRTVADLEAGQAVTIREDTDSPIDRRPLTTAERQLELRMQGIDPDTAERRAKGKAKR